MGYTTEFSGQFDLDRPLDDETYKLLVGLADTHRMEAGFKQEHGFGIDGEFYIGQDLPEGVKPIYLDQNTPPRTQPGLWCHWAPTDHRLHLQGNESEKFYKYVEWLVYLYTKILQPAGYKLTGTVDWQGEDEEDVGIICITEDGTIKTQKVGQEPDWKIWTEKDIAVKEPLCYGCENAEQAKPNCQLCEPKKLKRTMLDDYYHGQADSIDVASLRKLPFWGYM